MPLGVTAAVMTTARGRIEYAVVGVQSPTGYEEGRPLHTSW